MNTDQRADSADGKNSRQGHGNTPSQQQGRAPQGPIYLRTFKYFLTALHSCNLAAPPQQAAGLGSRSVGGARKHSRTALHANQPLLQSQFQLIFYLLPPATVPFSLHLIPPDAGHCEMFFSKLASVDGMFIVFIREGAQCEIKVRNLHVGWFNLMLPPENTFVFLLYFLNAKQSEGYFFSRGDDSVKYQTRVLLEQ